MIRIVLKKKSQILDEAASAETYMRQELRRLFPKFVGYLKDFLKSKKEEIVIGDELKFKNNLSVPVELQIIFKTADGRRQIGIHGAYLEPDPEMEIIFEVPKFFKTDAQVFLKQNGAKALDTALDTALKKYYSILYRDLQLLLLHELIHRGQHDNAGRGLTKDLKSSPVIRGSLEFKERVKDVDPAVVRKIEEIIYQSWPEKYVEALSFSISFIENLFSGREIEAEARAVYFMAKKERKNFEIALGEQNLRGILEPYFNGKEFRDLGVGNPKFVVRRLYELYSSLIRDYAKKHLFQKPIPKGPRGDAMQRQQGNYRLPT